MDILLVEDNEANRLLARSLIEREGHKLDFAENGLLALMKCDKKKYDLILMDILMPVMDGVKALRRLRRSGGRNAQTPVFALTGYSSQADKRRYRQSGFDLVLSKPLKPSVLGRAWESYIKGDIHPGAEKTEDALVSFKEIPLIDEEMIGLLLKSGSPDEIRHIATKFWESTKDFTALIRKNLALALRENPNALSSLRRAAHGIKGSAATLGVLRLSRIAARLQNAPPEKIAPLVLLLVDTMKPSGQALEQIIWLSDSAKTDSAAIHSAGADAQIKQDRNLPSPSISPSRHRISTARVPQQQVQVP